MLNEERIILMTKMASYEKGEGRKNIKTGNYYRSDYIAIQLMKAVVCATAAFALMLGLYILYDLEMFMQDLYKIDLLAYATNILPLWWPTVCWSIWAAASAMHLRRKN